MKRSLLVCIGILALALVAGAQIPNNHGKARRNGRRHIRDTEARALSGIRCHSARFRPFAIASLRFQARVFASRCIGRRECNHA